MAGRHRKPHGLRPPGHRGRHRKPASRQRAILPTIVIVAALAVGGVMFGHAVAQGQAPREAAVTPPAPPLVPPVVKAAPSSPAPPPAHHAKRTAGHHRQAAPALVVRDVGSPCYVEVTRHGRLITRRILHHGQRLTVREHHLRVVFGNAGAVRVARNGHHARRPGRVGQVRTISVR
jgi:hypothetical protein